MIETNLPKRQFLGKTENFTSKEDRAFNKRMLKAYLNGNVYFHYGYELVKYPNGIIKRVPKRHEVQQRLNVNN